MSESNDFRRAYERYKTVLGNDKNYEEWLEIKLSEEIAENDKLYKDIEELIKNVRPKI